MPISIRDPGPPSRPFRGHLIAQLLNWAIVGVATWYTGQPVGLWPLLAGVLSVIIWIGALAMRSARRLAEANRVESLEQGSSVQTPGAQSSLAQQFFGFAMIAVTIWLLGPHLIPESLEIKVKQNCEIDQLVKAQAALLRGDLLAIAQAEEAASRCGRMTGRKILRYGFTSEAENVLRR